MRQFYKVLFMTTALLWAGHAMAVSATPPKLRQGAWPISKSVTINVPGRFPRNIYSKCGTGIRVTSIQQALTCLNNTVISPAAIVTLNVTKSFTGLDTIVVDHPDGAQIHIVGNCGGNACILQFAAGQSGLMVQNGHQLGLFNNFVLTGVAPGNTSGIEANNRSLITLGQRSMLVASLLVFWLRIIQRS